MHSSFSRDASLLLAGILIGCLIATLGFALSTRSSGGGDQRLTVLQVAHSLDTNHPVHLAMERMAQRLEVLSDGSLQLRIAPNGQLGSETECIELLQRGALAIAKTSTGPLESFEPSMAVFGIPYLFRDEDHYWRVLEGPIGDSLLAAGEGNGLIGLCWYDAGARSFYTKSIPIESPTDLQGLKIRVQNSQTALRMVEALGGSPTPLTFAELYTGLQQGLVDGAENNPPSFWSSRHFEVCKQYSLDEHTRVPDVLLISKVWWNRLDEFQQGWLQQAAEESALWQREAWRVRTTEALNAVREAGVNVTTPDSSAFSDRVASMHTAYEGTEIGQLIESVKSTQ